MKKMMILLCSLCCFSMLTISAHENPSPRALMANSGKNADALRIYCEQCKQVHQIAHAAYCPKCATVLNTASPGNKCQKCNSMLIFVAKKTVHIVPQPAPKPLPKPQPKKVEPPAVVISIPEIPAMHLIGAFHVYRFKPGQKWQVFQYCYFTNVFRNWGFRGFVKKYPHSLKDAEQSNSMVVVKQKGTISYYLGAIPFSVVKYTGHGKNFAIQSVSIRPGFKAGLLHVSKDTVLLVFESSFINSLIKKIPADSLYLRSSKNKSVGILLSLRMR